MLSESLRVLYRADDASGTILVGSVLTALLLLVVPAWTVVLVASPPVGLAATPVVAIPTLVLRGYLISVVKSGIGDEATVPSFVHWGSLVRAGSSSTLLSVIYLLPAALLAGVAVGGLIAVTLDTPGFTETEQALLSVLILLSGFGLICYGLVYLYVRPAARAVFAASGSIRAALGVRQVLRLASTGDYVLGWLIAMGLLTVGPALSVPLGGIAVAVGYLSPVAALLIVLVTILLGICVGFILRVSAAWAIGRGATTGLTGLYLTSLMNTTADPGVVVNRESEPADPEPEPSRPEIDPTVQTGRTVGATRSAAGSAASTPTESENESESIDITDPDPTPTAETGTRPAPTDDRETVDHVDEASRNDDIEPQEAQRDDSQDTERHTEDDDSNDESSETDDTGFVWVDDDEP